MSFYSKSVVLERFNGFISEYVQRSVFVKGLRRKCFLEIFLERVFRNYNKIKERSS